MRVCLCRNPTADTLMVAGVALILAGRGRDGMKIRPACEISLQSYGFFVSITIFGSTVPGEGEGEFPEGNRLGNTGKMWY